VIAPDASVPSRQRVAIGHLGRAQAIGGPC
jgi:hypothetical protein